MPLSRSARWPAMALLTALAAGTAAPGAQAADGPRAAPHDEEAARAVPAALRITPREPPATGRIVAFDVVVPPPHPPVVELAGRFGEQAAMSVPWSENGRRWLVLTSVDIDTEARELALELQGKDARGHVFLNRRRFPVVEATYDVRHLRVSNRYVEPPKRARLRAARESEDLAEVLSSPDPVRHWRGTFQRPTDTRETSPFGTLRKYNKRKRPSRHLGWDLDGRRGDPIRAAARGRVALVQDRYYAGGTVVIDHGQGLFSMYFHMSRFDVEEGQMVEAGDVIGGVGSSGRVTGPHLHFSVKLDGLYLDPRSVLALDLDDDPALGRDLVDRTAKGAGPGRALGP